MTEEIQIETPSLRLRRYFFTGILITAPIGLTLYMAWEFIQWMDQLVTPYIPDALNPNLMLPFEIPGVGLIAALVMLTTIGAVMSGFVGNWFTGLTDALLNRLPVVRTIYTVIKQVLSTALTDQSKAFREAVLVEFPRKDCWVLGFVTSRKHIAIDNALGAKMISVMIPTTPTLSSGYVIFVAEDAVKPVVLPPEQALKMIISGGLIS